MQMSKEHIITSDFTKSDFFGVFILVVNALSWYFPLYVFFENIVSNQISFDVLLASFGIHYLVVIGSAILGTYLVKKFSNRDQFLLIWILIGTISTMFTIFLESNIATHVWLFSLLLGVSLGLGFPSCLAYFGDFSKGENRGRLGGIIFFASGICMLIFGLLISISPFIIGVLLLTTWRGVGLILFLLS